MGLLGDLTAYIDNLKRRGSNTLADLATNPLGLLSRNLSAFSESLPAAPDSVMPSGSGLLNRPGFQQWGMDVALNAPTMGLLGHTVYHGSPHKFDKFDASKIGTGEGAQAYGYGTYLADKKAVAKEYENLKPILDPTDGGYIEARSAWAEGKGNVKAALAHLDKQEKIVNDASGFLTDKGASLLADIARARELIQSGQFKPGNLYTVDLPDEWLPKMLDWDKPLSQQAPEVQAAMSRTFGQDVIDDGTDKLHRIFGVWDAKDLSGERLYMEMQKRASGRAAANLPDAANSLRQQGIPGIRYLDGGSRKSGEGTYNYVVFPGMEGLLKIISRE